MKRQGTRLRRKSSQCRVAKRAGGCLSGCGRKKKLILELQAVIRQAESEIDPLAERIQQCPEAFQVGAAFERLFAAPREEKGERVLPPAGAIISPFV
jgi:hypothetical protein